MIFEARNTNSRTLSKPDTQHIALTSTSTSDVENLNLNDILSSSTEAANNPLNSRWFALVIVCLAMAGYSICFEQPIPLQDALIQRFHLTNIEYELLFSMFVIPNIITPFIGGYVIYKLGTHLMILCSWTFSIIGILIFILGFASPELMNYIFGTSDIYGFYLMLVGRAIFGISGELFTVSIKCFLIEHFQYTELTFAFNCFMAFTSIGQILNMLFTYPLFEYHDNFYETFIYGLFFSIVSLVLMVLFLFAAKIYVCCVKTNYMQSDYLQRFKSLHTRAKHVTSLTFSSDSQEQHRSQLTTSTLFQIQRDAKNYHSLSNSTINTSTHDSDEKIEDDLTINTLRNLTFASAFINRDMVNTPQQSQQSGTRSGSGSGSGSLSTPTPSLKPNEFTATKTDRVRKVRIESDKADGIRSKKERSRTRSRSRGDSIKRAKSLKDVYQRSQSYLISDDERRTNAFRQSHMTQSETNLISTQQEPSYVSKLCCGCPCDRFENLGLSYWVLLTNSCLFFSSILSFYNICISYLTYHYSTIEMTTKFATKLILIPYVCTIILNPIIASVTDKHGKRCYWLLLSGCILFVVHCLFLFVHRTLIGLVLALTAFGVACASCHAILWSAISLVVQPHQIGIAYGLATAVQNAWVATVYMLVGVFADMLQDSTYNRYLYVGYLQLSLCGGCILITVLLKVIDLRNNSRLDGDASYHESVWAHEQQKIFCK